MFTVFCFIFALVPAVIGMILWMGNKRVVLWEVGATTGVCLVVAAIFQWAAVAGMTADVETWSGQVTQAKYQPSWVEAYEQAIYKTVRYTERESYTDEKGKTKWRTVEKTKRVFSHWESRTRNHSANWYADDTLVGSYGVDKDRYEDIKAKFGGTVNPVAGRRSTNHMDERNSHMKSGDPNDYITVNTANYVYPVTTTKHWENKVKAAPSLFSFHKVEVEPGQVPAIPVNSYPSNSDKFVSDRLFGIACSVSITKWDQLNAELGPVKKVNLVAVGFKEGSVEFGTEQEAAWIGGKKNDLVITFGGDAKKPSWVYVFGWTEQDIVKKKLESLILEKGFTNAVLPEIKQIVAADYVIKDWTKFDYLTVEVPLSRYIWLIVLVIVFGGGMITFAMLNDISKENNDQDEARRNDLRHMSMYLNRRQ